jgi:hypothetical protein
MSEAEIRSLESGANTVIANKLEHKTVDLNNDR